MAANSASDPKPSGNDPKVASGEATPVPLTFEDRLHEFWKQNRAIVLGLCAVVLIAIVGKGAWERHQDSKDREIGALYAAANTPEQLRAFAAAHPDHPLAALAELRIADEAYAAGKAAEALVGYDKALSMLKSGPAASRALLGRALAKVGAGKTAEGVADLKQLVNDPSQFTTARAEAAYQLASIAADSGNSAEVQKYVEQLEQISPAGQWAYRARQLLATLPPPPSPAAPADNAWKADAGPNLRLNLPNK